MGRRYRSLLWQWTRQLWRRPRPVEIEEWPTVERGQVAITRVGHATVLVRYHELAVLFDPVLTRFCNGVARSEAIGIDADALEKVELVLISNTSTDHFHRQSLAKLPRTATLVVPRGAARELAGLDFDRILELKPGQDFSHRGVEVTTAPGTHGSLLFLLRGDGPSVIYCGASGECEAFKELGTSYAPDVALLPIGGYSPKSFRKRNLTPKTALDAFEALRARVFVPHRYGAFAFSYERLDDPLRWLEDEIASRDLARYVELVETGETQLLVPPRGRAQTEFGEPRRPLGRSTAGSIDVPDADLPDHWAKDVGEPSPDFDSLDIDLDGDSDAGDDSDNSYDEIEVDADLLPPSDESLQGL